MRLVKKSGCEEEVELKDVKWKSLQRYQSVKFDLSYVEWQEGK